MNLTGIDSSSILLKNRFLIFYSILNTSLHGREKLQWTDFEMKLVESCPFHMKPLIRTDILEVEEWRKICISI